MNMTRTMGCVGDSIWFICVKRSKSYPDDVVTMWTLDLTDKQWKGELKVSAKELWGLNSFKEARLPKQQLFYPILTVDGALSLVLLDQNEFIEYDPVVDIICGFDMRLGNLLWHGRVHNFHCSDSVILPSNFFATPLKRKWDEHLPA